jgi:hypothetical protein
MSQMNRHVDFSLGRHGMIEKVLGSGYATRSDSSIGWYPVMDEPSKGWPFSKIDSISFVRTERLFRIPLMSMN